jgi:hypothetical protein
MITNRDEMTVLEALQAFYKRYGINADGGIRDPAVKVEVFRGFSLYIPNVEARKKIVWKHDIHHVLTGYSAIMSGEAEVSSWEIASGCWHWVPFTLNTWGMTLGFVLNPSGIWRAWKRGSHSRNLYSAPDSFEAVSRLSVGELKNELGLLEQSGKRDSPIAVVAFAVFALFGSMFSAASVLILPLLVPYSVVMGIQARWQKP